VTQWLIKRFIKDNGDDPNKLRTRYGNLAGVTGLLVNVFLSLIKFLAGSLSGSVAVTADALNNLSDSVSSILSLLSFRLSARPADSDHPYGHYRAELLLSTLVGASIIYVGGSLMVTSWGKVVNPHPISFEPIVAVILILSILLKLWMWVFYRAIGKRIGSDILHAAAADAVGDVLSTSAVLVSLILFRFFKVQLDGIMGIIVSLLILKNGIGIVSENASKLLGQGAQKTGAELLAFIKAAPGVLGAHDLMVHDYGQNKYATVDVELDANMTMEQAHALADGLERAVFEKYKYHLVIHVDPVRQTDDLLRLARVDVEAVLVQLDGRYGYHDLQAEEASDCVQLHFDVLIPPDARVDEEKIKRQVAESLINLNPRYRPLIRIERDFE
jgi:cation diffusion facilitator family transporter